MFLPLKYSFKRFFPCFLFLAFLGFMLYTFRNVPAFPISFKSYSYSISLRYFLLILLLLSIIPCGFDVKNTHKSLKTQSNQYVYWPCFCLCMSQPWFPQMCSAFLSKFLPFLIALQFPLTMTFFLHCCEVFVTKM